MAKTAIIMDGDNLTFRYYHSLGVLSTEWRKTGIVFGFLREIISLAQLFQTDQFYFCFDSSKSFRLSVFPDYKHTRRVKAVNDPNYALAKRLCHEAQHTLLPKLGFANILALPGYEADDLIAQLSTQLIEDGNAEKVVMVSTDQDLYQLLTDDVFQWKPGARELYGKKELYKEFGAAPHEWADVKAIMGCTTDDVPGIDGVGPKFAVKYLHGKLETTTKAYQAIINGKDIIKRNKHLVTLPYPGLSKVRVTEDNLNEQFWKHVCQEYECKSLLNKYPFNSRLING
jgi:DNA polymerase-1